MSCFYYYLRSLEAMKNLRKRKQNRGGNSALVTVYIWLSPLFYLRANESFAFFLPKLIANNSNDDDSWKKFIFVFQIYLRGTEKIEAFDNKQKNCSSIFSHIDSEKIESKPPLAL